MSERPIRLREELDEEAQRGFAERLAGVDASGPEGEAVLEGLVREAWDRVQLLALLRAVPPEEPNLPIGCVTDALIVALGEERARLAVWRAARCAARLPTLEPPLPASRIWALFSDSLGIVGADPGVALAAELERATAEAAEGELAAAIERVSRLAGEVADRHGYGTLANAGCVLHLAALRAAARRGDEAVDAGLAEVVEIAGALEPGEARVAIDALVHLALRSGRLVFGLDVLERAQWAPQAPLDRPVLVRPYFAEAVSEADRIIEDIADSMVYPPLSGATLMNLVRLELALQEAGQLAEAGVVSLAIDQLVDHLAASGGGAEVDYAVEVLDRRDLREQAGRLRDRFQRAR